MKPFKGPNLNAPRFRPKRLDVLTLDFCRRLKEKHPELSYITDEQVKDLVRAHNRRIWQAVIDHRQGVELPKQLGYIFIGTCPKKVRPNVDFKRSRDHGQRIQFQNWESDNYLAKIFYTNYECKYKFRFHDLWGFSAFRGFKRTLAQRYPKEWKKYVMVDNHMNIHRYYREHRRQDRLRQETQDALRDYNEFDL